MDYFQILDLVEHNLRYYLKTLQCTNYRVRKHLQGRNTLYQFLKLHVYSPDQYNHKLCQVLKIEGGFSSEVNIRIFQFRCRKKFHAIPRCQWNCYSKEIRNNYPLPNP